MVSGALHQHLVRPDTVIPTENGYFNYMGHVLKDTHPFPELSVHDIIVHSSNIGAAKLGIQLGEQRLYEYMSSLDSETAPAFSCPLRSAAPCTRFTSGPSSRSRGYRWDKALP